MDTPNTADDAERPSRYTIAPADWTISTKMLVVAVIAGVAMAATGWMASAQMENLRYADREDATQAVVESAVGVLGHYASLEASGELSREEAQSAALGVISALRYGEDDYFWVHDENLFMQMHPFKPELDGTDISAVADPNGVLLFVDMNAVVAAEGAGFVSYMWPKPGLDDPQPKLSYVAGFEEWGWVIGSGVYIDDIEAAVLGDLLRLAASFVIATTILLAVILWVRRSITGPVTAMTSLLETGDLNSRLDEGQRRTEMEKLATAVNMSFNRAKTVVDGVVSASEAVRGEVDRLNRYTGDESDGQQAAVPGGSDGVGLRQMADAVIEVDRSILTIADNAKNVSAVAEDAVEITARTNEVVGRLGTSSSEIEAVVETISEIAHQTNMLALNATIESSRAGEAGLGFGVVAAEVKELARKTAIATEDVSDRIDALRVDAQESAAAIAKIDEVVSQLSDFQTGIANAVEDHRVTMASVSEGITASSDAVAGSVRSLDEISSDLEQSIGIFASAQH